MITALVQFKLPERMTVEQARAVFASTAPRYLAMQGLVRKHYILSEDGLTAGGVYLWQTRADRDRNRSLSGSQPDHPARSGRRRLGFRAAGR